MSLDSTPFPRQSQCIVTWNTVLKASIFYFRNYVHIW